MLARTRRQSRLDRTLRCWILVDGQKSLHPVFIHTKDHCITRHVKHLTVMILMHCALIIIYSPI